MGGAPTIQGGMTADEQRALLAEEREFQAQEEEKRRQQAIQDELDRERRAKEEKERLAAEEARRLMEINAAEEAVIAESEGQKKQKEKTKLDTSFTEALLKGLGSGKEVKPQ
jgi:hypothetical protein